MTEPNSDPALRELLSHQDFVLRLARRLVGDPSRADDLAQSVWVKALESPPRALRSTRAWLSRVTRNLAINESRKERHLKEREEDVSVPEGSVAANVERDFEWTQTVAEAVRRLDEPYRTVVLLRYFKGLSHARIAEETGAPLATVRTRLQRAVGLLRERLDREHGRATWVNGLCVCFGKDLITPAQAGTGLIVGGMAMGTVAKLVSGVAAVSLLLWWFDGEGVREAGSAESVAMGEQDPVVIVDEAEVAGTVTEVEERRDAVPSGEAQQADPLGWFVHGRVNGDGRVDLAGGHVTIHGRKAGTAWPEELVVRHELTSEGLFELDVSGIVAQQSYNMEGAVEGLVVEVDHPRFARWEQVLEIRPEHHAPSSSVGGTRDALADLEEAVIWKVEAQLQASVSITGEVHLEDGRPATEAMIGAWRIEDGAPLNFTAGQASTRADGSFVLRVPSEGEYVLCAHEEGWSVVTVRFEADWEGHDVGSLVLHRGESISGRVLRLGKPVPGADVGWRLQTPARNVTLIGEKGMLSLAWRDGALVLASVSVETDDEGKYRVTGLIDADYAGLSGAAGGRLSLGGNFERREHVRATASGIDLEYPYAALSFESTEELDGMTRGQLTLERESGRVHRLDFQGWHGLPTLQGPPGEVLQISITFGESMSWESSAVFPEAGQVDTVSVPFEGGGPAARLTVRLERNHPEARTLLLELEKPGEKGARYQRQLELNEGLVDFTGLPLGVFRAKVRVNQDAGWWAPDYFMEETFELDTTAGGEHEHRFEPRRGGRMRIRAENERGDPIPADIEVRGARGEKLQMIFTAQGENTTFYNDSRLSTVAFNEAYPPLPPGEYTLHLSYEDYPSETVRVNVATDVTREIRVTLKP